MGVPSCCKEVKSNLIFRNKITYLSFVMAVLIVYRHAVGLKVYDIEGLLFWIELFISHLTDIIVPCFFAMSGYLFYQNFTWMKLKEKWKSRIKTIVFPFIVWNLVGFFFFFFSIGLLGDKINKTIPPLNLLDFFCDVFIYTKIMAALFIVITILCETIYDFEQGVVLMPIRLCQIIAIWILADLLAISTSPKWWMTISFFIYCSHSLILETIEKVFYLTFGNTSRGALIDFMCAPIITLIIIYGLAFYCRKIPKVWGLLVGYRK